VTVSLESAQSTDSAQESPDRGVRGAPRAGAQGGSGLEAAYARALLHDCGADAAHVSDAPAPHPALAWARSGAMALSGRRTGPPRLTPAPLAACAGGALRALLALAPRAPLAELDAPALLGERAAIFGFARAGRASPGGSCRLLRAADGWIALQLARPDDVALLPAWLGPGRGARDAWRFAARRVAAQAVEPLVARARLLGLPVAPARAPARVAPPWLRVAWRGRRAPPPARCAPRVVDLSSLWAGPLCAHLLALAGAEVVKVESAARPDGARRGPPAFFDLLHAGQASVCLDLRTRAGLRALEALILGADIVVESSRPRALAQLGVDVPALLARAPGLTWVGITGYGRAEPQAHWVAFGDDAAAAAGLAAASGDERGPLFCGDAIADPLAGLHAAVAGLAHWRAGGGVLLDVSLCDVVAHVLGWPDARAGAALVKTRAGWEVRADGGVARVRPPRARTPSGRPRPLGADPRRVLSPLAC
jgi:hypothetical protein